MKISIRRHRGTPPEKPTMQVAPLELDEVTGRPDAIVIEPESAAEVNITEAFNGVRFTTADGECLAVAMRDTGFEVHYWADFGMMGFDCGWWEFKGSHVRSMAPHSGQPLLGYATNRQLIEELQVRWSMGSTHPDYSTMTADRFGTDEYTVGEFTVAAIPAPVEDEFGLTEADADGSADLAHHDPIWEVPDEPWTPDMTKCYTCEGRGEVGSRSHDDEQRVQCPGCKGTGLADDMQGQLTTAVFQAIGSASMCWEHVDRAGVFHSERAKWVGDGLMAWLTTFADYRFERDQAEHFSQVPPEMRP
jgi:hypothetical protein